MKKFIPLLLAAALCLPFAALAEDAVSSASVADFYGQTALTGDDLMNAINSFSGFYLVTTTNPDNSPNAAFFVFGMVKHEDHYYVQLILAKNQSRSNLLANGEGVAVYAATPSSEEGAEILEEYKTAALELLITRQLLTEYAQREGYTNYTQEQRVEAKEYVEEYINSLIEQKKQELSANYTGEEEMDFTEQAKQSVEQAMADAGQTMDSLVEDYQSRIVP